MEPFKEFMNREVIKTLGDIFSRVWPAFDHAAFMARATHSLETLELKERVYQVRDALDITLPDDFSDASSILIKSLHPSEDTDRDGVKLGPEGACGFAVWPLTELVALRGERMANVEEALATLKELTKRFSAEFAVRPFLHRQQQAALAVFDLWTKDPNRHVRRLASEGSRPRLPWGMQLKDFVQDPTPLIPLLEALKDDPEEYVRRSVANNLNDIAKDHPDLVVEIAERWMRDATPDRRRMVKHACRTLIKQGNDSALAVFGYHPVSVEQVALSVRTPAVEYGDALEFDLKLDGLTVGGNIMIDYAIHFVKANGSRAPKVFKWKDARKLASGQVRATRRHPIKPITTRKYYPGRHMIEVIVNGTAVAEAEFDLMMS